MNKHLKMVRGVVWDMRASWRDLGVELGISVGALEVGTLSAFVVNIDNNYNYHVCRVQYSSL